jgi:ABC-type antimicrobial peptide transport system permease subunit
MTLVVQTAGPPTALAAPIRDAIRSVDRQLAINRIRTGAELVSMSASERRFAMLLFSLFASVALGLAAAGIYGVLSGAVAARTREMGLRAALGATRSGILGFIVREGMRVAVFGLGLGAVASFFLARLLGGLLYGVKPSDPWTLLAAFGLMTLVALAACAAPAWRAARVDPVRALNSD